MGRKPTPQPLVLADTNSLDQDNEHPSVGTASPVVISPVNSRSPRSQRSSPFQTNKFSVPPTSPPPSGRSLATEEPNTSQHQRHIQPARDDSEVPFASSISPASDPPSAGLPPQGPRQAVTDGPKSTKNSFFQFNKGSKSVTQSQTAQARNQSDSRSQVRSRGNEGGEPSRQRELIHAEETQPQKSVPSFPSRSDLSLSSVGDSEALSSPSTAKKNKSKSFGLLSRTKSNRDRDNSSPKPSAYLLPTAPSHNSLQENTTALRTAPMAQDRAFRDMMSSTVRNRSEDRVISTNKESQRDRENRGHAHAGRDAGGSTFLSGLRNSSTRAADLLGRGLFGKNSRSGSTNEREPIVDDEHYVLKVLHLPLVEQTRLTRISKRLEDSRDKTEFWMPAFPWRAIDYLNYKGCEIEGLYRVPGSGPQIKKWQRKFDEQYDVNLFEQNDLYDINIVGSMLKAWLRELPDELLPKEAQERIARECQGADKVPQLLIDELSNLSPFNYYLLFAITCHLSLLLAHSDRNKMDFRNLCICFQPCMKIDAFCFKFLVCDWRECWKGCKNEAKYIEEEYRLFDQPPPRGLADIQSPARPDISEDIEPSSPESAKLSIHSRNDQKGRLNKHQLQLSKSDASLSSHVSSDSSALSAGSEQDDDTNGIPGLTPAPTTASRAIRPLSPIQPLSPLGF